MKDDYIKRLTDLLNELGEDSVKKLYTQAIVYREKENNKKK